MEPSKRATVRWLINGLTRGAWLPVCRRGPFKVDNHPFPPVLLLFSLRYERFPPASQLTARENTTTLLLLQTLLESISSWQGVEQESRRKKKERKKGKKNKRDEERSSTKREPFRFTLPNAIPLALFPTFLSPRGGSGIKRGLGKTEDSARSVYIDSSSRNRDSWWRDSY